jgi:hypothetical protein
MMVSPLSLLLHLCLSLHFRGLCILSVIHCLTLQ